jgi:peptidyl-prolyl cis-trans isomerase A (cyclophilin A)
MRASRRGIVAAGLVAGGLLLAAAAPKPNPRVAIETAQGRIVVEVDVVHAPLTAANFLRYADEGLYRGASFYRAVRKENDRNPALPMSIIQGGLEPKPAPLPPIKHETTRDTGLRHLDGAISMARDGPGTATSEFFIVLGEAPGLDFGPVGRNPDGQGYAVFGRVVEGMDVVRRINAGPAHGGGGVTTGQVLDQPVPITAVRRLP